MTRRLLRRDLPWRMACGVGLALVMTILVVPACDKMPLVAPTGTTITLFASSTTLGLNASIEITANVIESAGTPVQNGTVVTFTTTLGTIEPAEARTNNGKASVRLVAGTRSGTAEVSAYSGGASTKEVLKFSVGAAAAANVVLLANPSALPASGGVVQLTAIVNDSSGNRLAGVPVSFTSDAGGIAPASVVSDGNGEARSALTTTAKSKVTASIVGGTGAGGVLTASLDIPVRIGPTVTISTPPANLVPGVAATFAVSVTAGGAAVRTATIDFGDGGSQAVSPAGTSAVAHVYGRSGTFIVTAVATDMAGETTTATASVSVQSVVVSVSLTAGTILTFATPIDFTATATITPAGTAIERYEWAFGDGSTATTSGLTTNHKYSSAGTYTVTVRAVTTTGASGTAQRVIVVP